jgi:large subunit ribosomal protein L30
MPRSRTKVVKQQAAPGSRILIQQVGSINSTPQKDRKVVKGLGFTRMSQVIEREDTLAIRGMVAKVPYLVQIVGEKKS